MTYLLKPYDDALQEILEYGVKKENRTGVDTLAVFGMQKRYRIHRLNVNNTDKKYLALLDDVIKNGHLKPNRTGVKAYSVFGRMLKFDLSEGFPLLTTKKVHFKSIVHELLWFLRGESNISYLKDNGVSIWDEWADEKGNLGPVYGVQWRKWTSVSLQTPRVFDTEQPIITKSIEDVNPDYSTNKSGLVGRTLKNKYGKYVIIREYTKPDLKKPHHNNRFVDVQFTETGYVAHLISVSNAKKGVIKDRLSPTFAGVGCLGDLCAWDDPNHSILYSTWRSMLQRCYNQNTNEYEHYGGKGVFVDNRWLTYSNFAKDAQQLEAWWLKKEFPSEYSLDKDFYVSNKYSLETCIWSNVYEQNINRDQTTLFSMESPDGEVRIMFGVGNSCKRYGLTYTSVMNCLDGKCQQHKGYKFNRIRIDGLTPRLRCIDQIKSVIANIKNNSESRRLMVSAWNPVDIPHMAIPPCHYAYSFSVHDNKLSCCFHMRSCDVFLGLPFNIASYALLTHMVAKICNLGVGELVWDGTDVHLYENHIEQAKLQMLRQPYDLPKLQLDETIKDIDAFRGHHITLRDYKHHSGIKAPIAV